MKSKIKNFEIVGTSSSNKKHTELDLLNLQKFNFSIFGKNDVICITSALSSPEQCEDLSKKGLPWRINVEGTTHLINKAISNGAKVIFFSSDVVYGNTEIKVNETSLINPYGNYAIMKNIIEKKFIQFENFKTIRLSYVFSRHDKFTKYLISCDKKNETAKIFKFLNRSVIHLQDVTIGILNLIIKWDHFRNYKFINFGGSSTLSRYDLGKKIVAIALKNLSIQKIDPPKNFFQLRPKIISMESPILPEILGRSPTDIEKAIYLEFQNFIN